MTTLILRVEGLSKSYSHSKHVIKDVSFSIQKSEVIGLLGPNGAGKSTIFYMLMGLIKPTSGAVYFNEEDVSQLPIYKRAQKGMGYLAQTPSVFKNLTVEKNLLAILEMTTDSKEKQEERKNQLLEEFGLTQHKNSIAGVLSGGERRRLEIARSLITNPSLLLLDEPFASIDPITVSEIRDLVLTLKNKGISVLITDHNAHEIFSLTDRNYLIMDGRVAASGTKEEFATNPFVVKNFLGHSFDTPL